MIWNQAQFQVMIDHFMCDLEKLLHLSVSQVLRANAKGLQLPPCCPEFIKLFMQAPKHGTGDKGGLLQVLITSFLHSRPTSELQLMLTWAVFTLPAVRKGELTNASPC